MGFKNTREEMGTGLYVRLEDDGDSIVVIFLDEPEPRHGTYRGKPRIQAIFPVCTVDGIKILTTGAKRCKVIEDRWSELYLSAVKITRHGVRDSKDTTYTMQVVKPSKALEKARADIESDELREAMENALSAETS